MFIPNWHGWAQQTNWIEVAPSGGGGWPDEYTSGKNVKLEHKKFAQVVWNLAPSIPAGPGDIPADSLTIFEVYKDGNDSYICEAPINSALSDSAWRVSRLTQNATTAPSVRWAEGGATNLAATDLATVKAYTYS